MKPPALSQRLILTWLGLAALAFGLMWLLAPVLTPFVVAGILAYVLAPLVDRLVRWRCPRLLAVLGVELFALALAAGVLLLIVPILTRELPLLREQIPVLAGRINAWLTPWLRGWGVQVSLDPASVRAFVFEHLSANVDEWLATALSSARIGGSFVLTVVGNAVMVPVVLFYLLLDWTQLLDWLRQLMPRRGGVPLRAFLHECDAVLGQYLRGQLLVMAVLALYYTVALALAGFDLALPVGVFTGLAIFIPYVGFGLGAALAVLAAALQFGDSSGLLMVAGIYGTGQVIESLFLTPRLVGERIGLHPIAVIFALLACGQLLGFVGVLLALPIGALVLVALRRLRAAYQASALFLN
jgi:predicted PurR-regulated permease PerM